MLFTPDVHVEGSYAASDAGSQGILSLAAIFVHVYVYSSRCKCKALLYHNWAKSRRHYLNRDKNEHGHYLNRQCQCKPYSVLHSWLTGVVSVPTHGCHDSSYEYHVRQSSHL